MRTGILGQVRNYFKFWLNSKPSGGHGIHSPYVYKLYTEVIEPDKKEKIFETIEEYRKELKSCGLSVIKKTIAEGINSGYRGEEVSLKKVARTVSVPAHLGRLLYRLCQHYKPQTILELGTSVGISTMYLATSNSTTTVFTIEGDETVLGIAQARFRQAKLTNIQSLAGTFDSQLPLILNELSNADLIFIDGDHNAKSLINYFNLILPKITDKSIIVVDDIRWSKGMEKAWDFVRSNPRVSISIDLFRCGILIFEKGITKQHFMLSYGPY